MNEMILDKSPESIPAVGRIGRTLRVFIGGSQLYFVWSAVTYFAALRYETLEDQPFFWAITALGTYFLPWAVNLGFHRILHVSRYWGFGALALGAVAAATWGYLQYQNALQPVLSAYLMVAAIYAHGHIGISNVLAGMIGLKGCEMRVIPYLITRLVGSGTELALCPGIWTPIDRWETGIRQENR